MLRRVGYRYCRVGSGAVVLVTGIQVGCRCLFATHYHTLATEFESNARVGLFNMAYIVDDDADHPVSEPQPWLRVQPMLSVGTPRPS